MNCRKACPASALFILFLFFISMVLPSQTRASVIELNYADLFPASHIQAQLSQTWAREIEKRSNGKVKITLYQSGVLLNGSTLFDGIKKGIADVGMNVVGYSRGRFPAMEAIDLPMGYPNAKVATLAANGYYQKYQFKEFSDYKVLYFHAHGPGLLHSKKPVHQLADINGLKIRSNGFSAKLATALGGVAVAMPQNEVYESLQKGVVDATLGPSEVLKGYKQAEVVKYTTLCDKIGYTANFLVMMNVKKWQSLPKEMQAIFEEVSNEWILKRAEAWDKSESEGLDYAKGLGNTIIPLSAEESKLWTAKAAAVIEEYIKEAESKGMPARDYVNTIKDLIAKYSK